MQWSRRIKLLKIRRLYRSIRLGIYDDEALKDVGSELYARCADIAAVADAHRYGVVPCPQCDAKLQRQIDAMYGLEGHGAKRNWFHCPHCAKQLLWTDCRDALRKDPRCFSCYSRLQGKGELKCSCGKVWERKAYRRSISTRVLLPCPHCNTVIRKPRFAAAGQETENHAAARQVQCPKCPATALHIGGFIECAGCGFKRRWRDYRRSLKRKDEKLTCPKCEHTSSF